MKRLFTCFMTCAMATAAQAATIYVTVSGGGSMNGASWADAYPGDSLRAAIDGAAGGDEVWVAAGIYYTTTGADRTESFRMKNGVLLAGSFAGTETLLSERDLTNGLTSILSAEIGLPGIADNSYHVFHNQNLDNSATIDGFIVRDANDNRPALQDEGLGGGFFNDGSGNGGNCSPTIRNCLITGNRAVFGAGIFNSGYQGGNSEPVILNCVIAGNHATTGGGGMDNFGLAGNASPLITNCVFYMNTATFRAGAMYNWGGNNGNASPAIINSVFIGNSGVDGGGIVCDNLNSGPGSSGNSDPTFKNCIFSGNTATTSGPNFFILGTGTFSATYTAIDLSGQTSPHVMTGPATGNIAGSPMLVSAGTGAGADGIWMTWDDGLRLQQGSPCIDAGNNGGTTTTDITGAPRIENTFVDMGAYEFVPSAVSVAPVTQKPLLCYPNPVREMLHVTGLPAGAPTMHLVNGSGAIVWTGSSSPLINMGHLPAGLYLLVVESNDGRITQRIIRE